MKSPSALFYVTFSKLFFFCFVLRKPYIYLQVLCSPGYIYNLMGFDKCMYLYHDNEYFHHPGSSLVSLKQNFFFKIDEFCCHKTSHKNKSHSTYSLVSRFFAQHNVCKIYPCYWDNGRVWFLFSFQVIFHCVDVQNLFISSPADEHLVCFQMEAIMNKIAMNILV